MRFGSKELIKKVTGHSWAELRESRQPEFSGRNVDHQDTYEYEAGTLKPRVIHPEWLKIIGKNSEQVRMCHHSSKLTWCGTCYLATGFITKTPPRTWEPLGGRFKKKTTGPKLPFSE